jgi:hypothetical protein
VIERRRALQSSDGAHGCQLAARSRLARMLARARARV